MPGSTSSRDEKDAPAALERGVRLSADIYNRGSPSPSRIRKPARSSSRTRPTSCPSARSRSSVDEAGPEDGESRSLPTSSRSPISGPRAQQSLPGSGLGAPLAGRISESSEDPAEKKGSDLVFDRRAGPSQRAASLRRRRSEPARRRTVPSHPLGARLCRHGVHDDRGPRSPARDGAVGRPGAAAHRRPPWQREMKGFFQGDLAIGQLGLASLEPYRHGRIPVVLVHGTASSAGRWADLLNDLESDPVIRHHYEFWLFSYNTGNPIAYSGWLLRDGDRGYRRPTLDPEGRDRRPSTISWSWDTARAGSHEAAGHRLGPELWDSVIDEPPDQLELDPGTASCSRAACSSTLALREARIFLSTPHRGTRLAPGARDA